MQKALFICNMNRRAATAAALFKDRFETRSAGLYNEFPVTLKEIEWADIIFVMSEEQQEELLARFPQAAQKKIVDLDAAHIATYQDPMFIAALKEKMNKLSPNRNGF